MRHHGSRHSLDMIGAFTPHQHRRDGAAQHMHARRNSDERQRPPTLKQERISRKRPARYSGR
eukprot:7388353-Pyramimonas_sp.AAC.1